MNKRKKKFQKNESENVEKGDQKKIKNRNIDNDLFRRQIRNYNQKAKKNKEDSIQKT